jgi:DNA (cytosine-5)-methyltransferase 1
MTTYGELFAGYGGLSLGLAAVLGGEVTWWADNDPAASKVMARAHPHAPNLGDVTAIDWATVPPVDILTGGTPCQDVSVAGKRAGMGPGTRSGLWASMRDAIAELRPTLVVWENVKGALSVKIPGPLESCPWCVGDRPSPTLRPLGKILGDLADLGYDAAWVGLRAADVGACHERFRVFVFATDPHRAGLGEHGRRVPMGPERLTPQRDSDDTPLTLLPTPAAFDMGYGSTPEEWEEWTAITKVRHGNGNGHGDSLAIETLRAGTWARYAPAIERHTAMIGRTPPPPTEDGQAGPRLSPAFVEWMMGLPAGHITAPELGLSQRHALRVLGNGVVPQQAAAAAAWWVEVAA